MQKAVALFVFQHHITYKCSPKRCPKLHLHVRSLLKRLIFCGLLSVRYCEKNWAVAGSSVSLMVSAPTVTIIDTAQAFLHVGRDGWAAASSSP